MKNLLQILKRTIVALSFLLITSTVFAGNQKEKKVDTVIFKVEMDCVGCTSKIEKNIPFEKGVKDLKVDFKKQQVSITFKTKVTSKEKLKKAVEKLEFKVQELKE
ncbi:heavy metal-associated domain-containing protein [Labilibaculum sp. K2S]|uniref:heavy-metal-associated domain-containing protein n=1 Tax=Labilibaculum sp. K2S TaxID=3056386 RepID=UPI0025A38ADA|nr:heavy metal-associated domain-containing protein [Labilibaculum sp. K2S]MDM8161909.1 heavy metal-associated domain-containing protein [Labilibaculum sp. K2S]